MATTSQEYTIERKTGDNTSEEIQIPASSVVGLADVATSGSYNDLKDTPEHCSIFTTTFTGNGSKTTFEVDHQFGADVTVQVYLTSQSFNSNTVDELVLVDTYTKRYKTFINFATAPTTSQTFKVVITGVLQEIGSFQNTDWETIRKVVLAGDASKYWSIGDTKHFIVKNKTQGYDIRLCDLQDGRYEYSDGSGSSKAVFEFVQLYEFSSSEHSAYMNTSNKNTGGYADTRMRSYYMPLVVENLPDDMVSAMSQVKVLSTIGDSNTTTTKASDNTLFLPAYSEVYGSSGNIESPLGTFDYYKLNSTDDARIKYHIGYSDGSRYWLRSPYSNKQFYLIQGNGQQSAFDANSGHAIAPIFAI